MFSRISFNVYLYIIYFVSLILTTINMATIYFRPGVHPDYNSCGSRPYFSDVNIRWGMSLSELNPLNTICPGGDALFSESEKTSIPIFFFLYIASLATLLYISIRRDILLLKSSQSLLYKIKEVVFFRGTLYLLMPFVTVFTLLYVSFSDTSLISEGLIIIALLWYWGQVLTLLNLLLNSIRYIYGKTMIYKNERDIHRRGNVSTSAG